MKRYKKFSLKKEMEYSDYFMEEREDDENQYFFDDDNETKSNDGESDYFQSDSEEMDYHDQFDVNDEMEEQDDFEEMFVEDPIEILVINKSIPFSMKQINDASVDIYGINYSDMGAELKEKIIQEVKKFNQIPSLNLYIWKDKGEIVYDRKIKNYIWMDEIPHGNKHDFFGGTPRYIFNRGEFDNDTFNR